MSSRRLLLDIDSIPSGYTRCEYLESTGTQYIDTLFTHESYDEEIYIKISPSETGVDRAFFGVYTGGAFELGQIGSVYRFNVSMPSGDETKNLALNIGEIKEFLLDSTGCWKDLSTNTYFGKKATEISYHTAILFGRYYSSEEKVDKKGSCKIYKLKIKKNGKLVLNLIPCLDLSETPCMYDTVNKNTLYNSGTGTFSYNIL